MPLISGGAISALAISAAPDEPTVVPVVATGATDGALVVVDLYFYNPAAAEATLRIVNMSFFGGVDKTLLTPFTIGSGVEIGQPAQAFRTTPNAGRLQYVLTEENLPYLDYSLLGRKIEIYVGNFNYNTNTNDELVSWDDPFVDNTLVLAFKGIVSELSCDFIQGVVTVDFTDNRKLLDIPVIGDLYTAPDNLKGDTKPKLWGIGYSIAPVLEDPANLVYRVSTSGVNTVDEVRVGGIIWEEVFGTPSPGEWLRSDNVITLGGVPGSEVRVDARSEFYDEYLAGNLVAEIIQEVEVEPGLVVDFNVEAYYRIGYYVNSAVNKQDALDDIMHGIGGWWGLSPDGKLVIGLVKVPSGPTTIIYNEQNIAAFELVRVLSPIWRLAVQWRRNWQPGTAFYDGVASADKEVYEHPGAVTDQLSDDSIKTLYPDAVDAQTIPSIIISETHAETMRDNLWDIWSVVRRVWQIRVVPSVPVPSLMDVVEVDYPIFGSPRLFRVVGVIRSYGGGLNTITLWG